ncbi:MAG: phosphate ABC transporter permease subunit PstC [Thermoplasmata archaeon]|nr:phosphate ABC transporter permease subunit PstC [Thermoplasmata archaeon]
MTNLFSGGRPPRRGGRPTHIGDRIFSSFVAVVGLGVLALVGVFVLVLLNGARPSLLQFGGSYFVTATWDPPHQIFGVAFAIEGTLVTSAVALLIAIPLSLGAAIFLSEHAPGWLRDPIGYVIELLAAVPSVVYGFWGFAVLVPVMRSSIEPGLRSVFGWTQLFNPSSAGHGDVFTASVVLAIMVIPTISAISRESLAAVPREQREAALSLGATKWETTRLAVLKYARTGIIGGVILGLGRAIGETMAVTMTIGNRDAIFTSLLAQGQTLASLIANEFTEATGTLYPSALIEAGLVLLLITLAVNVVARLLVWRVTRSGAVAGGA